MTKQRMDYFSEALSTPSAWLRPSEQWATFRTAIRAELCNAPVALSFSGRHAVLSDLIVRMAYFDDVQQDAFVIVAEARSQGPVLIPTAGDKKTAIVPVKGVATFDLEMQPMAFSTRRLEDTLDALAEMQDVEKVILDVDSPGGAVTGTAEAADAVFRLRQAKEVVAVVDPLAASAAYWIASQATSIQSIPSGEAGSIGVFLLHVDLSGMLESAGIKPTFIFAGPHKVDANAFEPLADEARDVLQADVDEIYDSFVQAVARGRGVDPSVVEEKFGGGRVMMAREALDAGLIDGVSAFAPLVKSLGLVEQERKAVDPGGSGSTTAEANRPEPQVQARVSLHRAGRTRANAMIQAGDVNRDAPWSFSAEDGNALLGPNGDDWANYGRHHLGRNTEADAETKDGWRYPFAKRGSLYRSALVAIRQRSSQQGHNDVFEAAGRLLEQIDGDEEESSALATVARLSIKRR